MADSTTSSSEDIGTAGSEFTFTGKLAEFAGNEEWTNGYLSISDGGVARNDYSTMWEMLSAGTEDCGNRIYREIRSYIDKVGNVDTCGLHALKNFADMLNFKDDLIDADMRFPSEIMGLVEIFSVNSAYLLNKADKVSDFVLSNSILDADTAERFGDSLKDREKFKSFVANVIYNTLFKFLTLKVGKFDDGKTADYDKEIWRCNISRFTDKLWSDDVETDSEVFALKSELGVGKSFTEKVQADKVISGEKMLSDFSYEEQKVISAEIKARKTRYSDAGQMRYYYMRVFKVLEYFRFVTLTYRKIYELSEYDISSDKFVVNDISNGFSLVVNNYADYEIDKSVVHKVAEWIADFCINVSYARARVKRQSQKNMMKGTKRLIVDSIKEFILEQIDADTWKNFKNSILFDAKLNVDFGVSLIEYADNTEYFNIEKDTDVVDSQKNDLNPQYWKKYGDSANAFSKEETLSFYNRMFSDRKRFSENGEEGGDDAANLYEFLKLLFEGGASSAINSDYFAVSETLTAKSGSEVQSVSSVGIAEKTAAVFEKFSGDPDISDKYYLNIKNTFHPSYQIHPFVQGFEEYNVAYTSVMNLVNSFSDTIETSIARLSDRIDKIGCTINFWYNWNEDFTGYSTNFEKGGSDSDSKVNQDSPFNFDALQEFITFPDEYILNILQGMNKYYISDLSGKPLFSSSELSIEISRLQKYRQEIMDVSGKAIYKYAKDFYGNIYILYKDEEDRTNRNALGNVWIRMKNHPIAFPLFDVTDSSTPFSSVSCLSDSNNTKLVKVLRTIVRRFSATYGIGNGYVDTNNLMLSFDSKTASAIIVADESGKPVKGKDITVGDKIENTGLRLIEIENAKISEAVMDVGVKRISDLPSPLSATEYFVDTVNGKAVAASLAVSSLSGGRYFAEDNPYGQVCHVPTSAFLKATYEDNILSILRNTGGKDVSDLPAAYAYLTFADYDDESVYSDVPYYYTNEYGIVHPCGKRRITIRNVYNIPSDPSTEMFLRGDVKSDGSVNFGVWTENSEEKTVRSTDTSFVDGVDIYEDFDAYTYSYMDGSDTVIYRYHPEMGAHDIVMVGGSNPYYVKRTSVEGGADKIEMIKADRTVDAEPDTYVFSNGAYNNIVGSVHLTSFPLSDCQFRKNERYENVFDTIHQFQLKDNQYINYYPYTEIIVGPTEDPSKLDSERPSGCITFYDDETDTVGHKFYYNIRGSLKDFTVNALSAKVLTYETSSMVISSKNVRLNGSLVLYTNDSSKFPVTLTFNGDKDANIATFSTYYGGNEYKKFFDMGFSYDQKMMYMSYREDDDEYENGGVLIGRISESDVDDYVKISYYRDGVNNVEGVEPSNIKYYHQMSEQFEYFRQDYLSGNPYYVLKTQIPLINGKAMTFQSLNDKLIDGNSWQSIFMNTSSMEISALTGMAETDTRMLYTTLTSITGLVTSSIEYRTYVDNIKTRHIGETVAKRGIYSAFGSFNERDRLLNLTIYRFTNDSMQYSNFAIPLKFAPMEFVNDSRGRISTKLSCTDRRIYLSFASQPPSDDDIVTNGINGHGAGDIGSAHFGSVSDKYGDGTITILSFSIENAEIIEYKDDETRYILKSGELGYFPQYGGLNGKNLIFRNASLSGNDEFPFEVDFGQVGSSDDVRMTRTVVVEGGGLGQISISKFINLDNKFSYSSVNNSRGLILTETGYTAFYVPFNKSVFENNSKMYPFKNIGGRRILDASRPHVNANTGEYDDTVILADGNAASRYVGAITSFATPSALTVAKMSIFPDGRYDMRTDFREIKDTDGGVYAFHSDGKTISKIEIAYRESDDGIPSDGIAMHTLTSFHSMSEDIIDVCGDESFVKSVAVDGYDGFSNDVNAKYAVAKSIDGGKMVVDVFNYGDSGRVLQAQFAVPSENISVFFSGSTPFAVIYDRKINKGEAFNVYSLKNGDIVDLRTPYFREPILIEPVGQRIRCFEDTLVYSAFDDRNPTEKIFITNTQRVYRLDLIMTGDTPTLSTIESDVFDRPVEDGILSSDTEQQNNVEVNVGHSVSRLLFSYYSEEQDAHGMVWCRKDTPDSVGEYCSFYDESGNAIGVNRITKILSNDTTVVVQDELGDTTSLLVSTDDGVTFVRRSSMNRCNIRLIGCDLYGFYAHADNGSLIRSSDGVNWTVDISVPFSRWTSVVADGKQYLLCVKADTDLSEYVTDRYLKIEKQITIDSECEFKGFDIDDDGNVVAFSCEDVKTPLSIARFSTDDFNDAEIIKFPYVRGTIYDSSYAFNGSLFLLPESSDNVLKISDVFDMSKTPSAAYISIGGVGAVEGASYGGFLELGGSLIVYPQTTNDILVYNENENRFFEYCTIGNATEIVDCDAVYIERDDVVESVLTPKMTESDGTLNLIVTNVTNRENYAIVEIDEGFPIIVEYSVSTVGDEKTVTQFKFTMSSDKNRSTATITTVPDIEDSELRRLYEKRSSATVSYTVGGKTLIYSFSTVDSTPKYVIRKNVGIDVNYEDNSYLKIKYSLNDFNRASSDDEKRVHLTYTVNGDTKYSVYDDFNDDIYIRDIPSGSGTVTISAFADYIFADSVSLSGRFNSITTMPKDLVVDCNLAFNDKTVVSDCTDMFNGCVNAEMTEPLDLNGEDSGRFITRADRMFKDCTNAKLPSVTLADSNIEFSESMFENCTRALLANVDFPANTKNIRNMFKNCRNAAFESVTLIPETVNLNSAFYSCENGSFRKASFFSISGFGEDSCARTGYDAGYMFYMCQKMNAQLLSVDRITPFIKNADCMFYGAGRNSSNMFNDTLMMFGYLESGKNLFTNSNFEFDNTFVQFHGIGGVLKDTVDSVSIQNCMKLNSIKSYFENTKYAIQSPAVILASSDISIANVNSALDGALYGHYYTDTKGEQTSGIFDFSSLYRNSSIRSVDFRGIANNSDLDGKYAAKEDVVGCQNFSSVCENCGNLETIVGYIPPYGNDYSFMFCNCSSLDVDVSQLFRVHDNDGGWRVKSAYSEDGLKSYSMSSISHMFDGCHSLFSSDNAFDLAMIVDRCAITLGNLGYDVTACCESFENAFNGMSPIVLRETVDDLKSLVFDIDAATNSRNAVKYAVSDSLDAKYGIKSGYMEILYTDGFMRYCGTLREDPTRFVAVMYYPIHDVNGKTISLKPKTIGRTIGVSPSGFADRYNVAQTHRNSTWYEYDYDRLYAAAIFDVATNTFVKFAYVGEYDLIKHEYVISDGVAGRADTVSRVGVSVFSGLESTINAL